MLKSTSRGPAAREGLTRKRVNKARVVRHAHHLPAGRRVGDHDAGRAAAEGTNAVGVTGKAPLRIGMIGSGFMARFHLQAMIGVRDAVIAGVFSPDRERREEFRRSVDAAGVGPCRSFASVEELAGADEIDAIWIV